MRVALSQLNPTVGALGLNAAKVEESYRTAVKSGAELVLFSELCLCGYPPKDLLLYDNFVQRERELILNQLAPLTANGAPPMLIGATHREEEKLFNAALLLDGGSIKAVHRKSLLPNYDVFDESRYFFSAPNLEPEKIAGLPTAVTICEDIWNDRDFFQSSLYDSDPLETLLDSGTKLLINLSASPYHLGKHQLREELLAFIAKKYGCGIIYLNQVGGNDELIFDGHSLVLNYRGELLYRAKAFSEDLLYIESEDLFKPAERPAPQLEEGIDTIYRALVMGIRDYVWKTGFSKVVLGLSGGVDSALVAALAADAVGPENVLGILMPSPYSSEHSIEDALVLAKNLGIKHRIKRIDKPFKAFLELLNENGAPELDLAEENLQARIRGSIVMHASNREGYLALATGNKSELAVGYCTLYGDMAGGLAVIADLPKMMVYELSRHINSVKGSAVIPESTITKPPSAELRPDQKDEDSLPPYETLDPILQLYIEENASPEMIKKSGFDSKTVDRVLRMVDRAEFKRRQAAPGLRVTTRAFGSGRRMPIARSYEY